MTLLRHKLRRKKLLVEREKNTAEILLGFYRDKPFPLLNDNGTARMPEYPPRKAGSIPILRHIDMDALAEKIRKA